MATTGEFFVYSWHNDTKETNTTVIRAYGLDKNNKNVCLVIHNFTPYVYLELPDISGWKKTHVESIFNKICTAMGADESPLSCELVYKKRLYYAYMNSRTSERKRFPYIVLTFANRSHINKLQKILYREKFSVLNFMPASKLKMHESNASNVLQLCCARKLTTAGWISYSGDHVSAEDRVTSCDYEISVNYKHLKSSDSKDVVRPYIMSYDWEVNSSDITKMPDATNPKDVMFQCSCVFGRLGDPEEKYEKYLLSLYSPDPATVGKDVIIRTFGHSEVQILEGFSELIREKQPNIICGYNIFTFDIDYMITRADTARLLKSDFDKQGFHLFNHAEIKDIKWSSSAYKDQSFKYMDVEGRLFVDLLPVVKRDYKLDNYKLKTVSSKFLGETKDPLTPKGIFKCYRMGMKGGRKGNKAMGIVGKYCVQDSALVLKLFETLLIWYSLTEMAKVCMVPIFSLYTQGQQIKVFSQIYKKCMYDGYVVDKDSYVANVNERYQGAFVIDPIPGVYDCVVPFDFASLYPSVIMAYNICYSTLVTDNAIPDSLCHVIEWEDHVGCQHDTKVHKTKVLKVMCGHNRYRFLRDPPGVLPTTIKNLIDARKETRNEMAVIKANLKTETDPKKKDHLNTMYNVLDKRQLSLKVSANSMYGAMGVQSGYLPFMPGAMSVTAKGRESISKVKDVIPEKYGGQLVYGDTDSNYVTFPHLKTAEEIWTHSELVSEEVSKLFPKPMKLEFEGVIYWRFLILTKKRYMSWKCDRQGNISREIEKKGVLLSRRDNSNFVRSIYADLVMNIFHEQNLTVENIDNILYKVIELIVKLFSRQFSYKDFIITKSVGSIGDVSKDLQPVPIENNKNKVMIGSYKVPILSTEPVKRAKQLKDKDALTPLEFYEKCLPGQVQLAQRIRHRGGRVDTGSRLEFLVTDIERKKAKLYEKLESAEYYKDHSASLKVDYLYYLKALSEPVDQIVGTCFSKFNQAKYSDFIKNILKTGTKRQLVIDQLNKCFAPTFKVIDEN